MDRLKRHDSQNLIHLVNLRNDSLLVQYPDIDLTKALNELHGIYKGKILLGLDVTYKAWSLVGAKCLVSLLKMPLIKNLAEVAYRTFAKYREPVSRCLHKRFGIGMPHCEQGKCYGK